MTIRWLKSYGFDAEVFRDFVQRQANRLAVGHLRYGPAHRRKKYMSRLQIELDAYKESGNREHLINIANYAILESFAPEHPQAHFDNMAASATRHRFGGVQHEGD
jgi:hypothetical protein